MKLALFTLLPAALILAACGTGEPRGTTASAASAPVAVQVAAVAEQEWPDLYEATGTVRARTAAVISSKVMGHVEEVRFQVGERVSANQLLARLDSRDLEANVRRAEAARAELQSAVPEADNGIAAAKANLDLAQATFKRMEQLAAKKSISDQEFDEASARLKGAQANYEMARARRMQLDSKVAQVEQEIRAATVMRDYTKITAPFSGVVTTKSVEAGSLASPGAPLLTLEQEGGYRLEVSVEESRIASIRPGQQAAVSIEALDRKLDARVSEIVPSVDASSRSYVVKLDLPALPQLRSGMFGRASFAAGAADAACVMAVPAAALQERGQLASVFVVEDAAAHSRLVTTGRRRNDGVEILSGLTAGERVIVAPPASLADGARVEIRQ
jgi:membrane fusion protein, multidrug efflux system